MKRFKVSYTTNKHLPSFVDEVEAVNHTTREIRMALNTMIRESSNDGELRVRDVLLVVEIQPS